MGRRADPYRVRCSQIEGAVAAIRDVVLLDDQDRLERVRQFWPELVERIESAAELIPSPP